MHSYSSQFLHKICLHYSTYQMEGTKHVLCFFLIIFIHIIKKVYKIQEHHNYTVRYPCSNGFTILLYKYTYKKLNLRSRKESIIFTNLSPNANVLYELNASLIRIHPYNVFLCGNLSGFCCTINITKYLTVPLAACDYAIYRN